MEVKTEDIWNRLIDNESAIRVMEQRIMNVEQVVIEIKGLNRDTRDIIDGMSHRFSSLGWKVGSLVSGLTVVVQAIFLAVSK